MNHKSREIIGKKEVHKFDVPKYWDGADYVGTPYEDIVDEDFFTKVGKYADWKAKSQREKGEEKKAFYAEQLAEYCSERVKVLSGEMPEPTKQDDDLPF